MKRIAASALIVILIAAGATPARAVCYEPSPDPLALGWAAHGQVLGFFSPGEPVTIDDAAIDPSPQIPEPFLTFYCVDDALFATDLTVSALLVLDPNALLPNPGDGNTGVHVTLNAGDREIRAVCFALGGGLEVRVRIAGGFTSSALTFGSLTAAFSLTRRAPDGAGILAAVGQDPIEVPFPALPLPLAQRGGKAIEFGTYDVPAKSRTQWSMLGLPSPPTAASPSTWGRVKVIYR